VYFAPAHECFVAERQDVLDDTELMTAVLVLPAELRSVIGLNPLVVEIRADLVEYLGGVGRVVGDAHEIPIPPPCHADGVHDLNPRLI